MYVNHVQLVELILDARSGFASGAKSESGVAQIRMNNVTTDGSLDFSSVRRVPRKAVKNLNAYVLRDGDVLFNSTNSSNLVGKTARFVEQPEPFTFSNHFIRLEADPVRLDNRYLARWLTLQQQKGVFELLCTKWVNQAAVRRDDLLALKIPLPPLPEQQRIAAVLDAADALRAKRRAALAKLDTLLQSVFLEMFGDPVTNPMGWEVSTLGSVCVKITDGTHHSPPILESGIPYITAKHIRKGRISFFADPWYIAPEDHEVIYKRCDPVRGDVLYIKDGATTGMAAINQYDFEFSMLSSLALLRPNLDLVTPSYLRDWLNNPVVKAEMLQSMGGAAIRRLTLQKLRPMRILLPPRSIQEGYAAFVGGVEHRVKQVQEAVELQERLFGTLQQRAFRGELK